MSGPKVSVYKLNRILAELMRCEQESVVCTREIQDLIQGTLSYSGELQKQISQLELLANRGEVYSEKQENLQRLLIQMQDETTKLKSALIRNMPHVSQKYIITEEALKENKQKLAELRAFKKQTQKLREKIDSAVASELDDKGSISSALQQSIEKDLGKNVSFYTPTEINTPNISFEESKASLQSGLASLIGDSELPENLVGDIKKAIVALDRINQIEYLHSFDSVTIRNIYKKIDSYKQELKEKQIEFNDVYSRYNILCNMAQEPANNYLYSEEAFNEIQEEIERLETTLMKMKEQSYVKECVDQVMNEMGYDLIGSREVVKKKSGKQFHNELFTFNEGTAVNITYASDGQISMELGGIAREDRIPNQEEAEMLTHDMETFCGEFEEFERRMMDNGVIVSNRIALSPPSIEYAAIINISDYNVTEEMQITEMKTVDRRKKITEKKIMRRTE